MPSEHAAEKQDANQAIHFAIVTGPQQWLHALTIRSICFFEENNAAAELVFDGNDYTSTHVIAYDGSQPIGTVRIRWFKDFAKVERASFRRAYRGAGILRKFAPFVFDHITRKGYTRVVTHAEEKYAELWVGALGFKRSSKEPAYFVGQEPFHEIWCDLPPATAPITQESSCAVLFRTEGHWDEPGAFETGPEAARRPSRD